MNVAKLIPTLVQLIRHGAQPLLVGGPGVGKTAAVLAAVRELGYDLIFWHLAISDPTDVRLPVMHNGEADFVPAGLAKRLLAVTRPTVVFMDDLGQASPATQASAMQVVHGGTLENMVFPREHLHFVGATNRRTDKAGSHGVISPMLNRFAPVLHIDADPEAWKAYAIRRGLPEALIGFIGFKPQYVSGEPDLASVADLKPLCTPRSVEAAAELLAAGIDDPEVIAGCCGEAFAADYLAYLEARTELPTFEQICNDPTGTPVPEKPATLFALAAMLAYRLTAENAETVMTYLLRMRKEWQVTTLHDAVTRDNTLLTGGQRVPALERWIDDNGHLFVGAEA